MTNIFGSKYKITIYGESHSPFVGVKIEGVEKGIALNINEIEDALRRRKEGELPQFSAIATTKRKEQDTPIFLSGISQTFQDKRDKIPSFLETTGEPIVVEFKNDNIKPSDYKEFIDIPRPSHADFVNKVKYGEDNEKMLSGGGIASGRMTLPLTMAGAIALQILQHQLLKKPNCRVKKEGNISIKAHITSLYGEQNPKKWGDLLQSAAQEKDSIGGVIECLVNNLPAGIGEPFFNSLESIISHLVFSIPGIKGIEFGNGFDSAKLKGSQNNDCIADKEGKTKTNNSGGINGGISNGNPIIFRVAVKPTSSIGKPQESFNFKSGKIETLEIKGRHDACFALRVPVIIEAVAAIALLELLN